MKYYIELTLLPDGEISVNFLWGKLYQQLHLAWVETKNETGKVSVGASFPKYDNDHCHLGCKLRLFARSEAELESMNLTKWLSRLSDYVHVERIQNVPAQVNVHAYFSRLTEKGSDERLARPRAKTLGVSYEEALVFFKDKEGRLQPKREAHLYPFISMRSLSSDGAHNTYPLTVVCTETDHLSLGKGFSTYGLSSDSSVPMFR